MISTIKEIRQSTVFVSKANFDTVINSLAQYVCKVKFLKKYVLKEYSNDLLLHLYDVNMQKKNKKNYSNSTVSFACPSLPSNAPHLTFTTQHF